MSWAARAGVSCAGVGNQTRFDSATGIIVTQYGIGKEMLVAPNGTCTQYCPTQGAFDPSPFWPSVSGARELPLWMGR